jgi:hypothetical protein
LSEYRIYILGSDGRFLKFRDIICRDEGEAVAKAKRLVDDHDLEVWGGNRFVIRLFHKAN